MACNESSALASPRSASFTPRASRGPIGRDPSVCLGRQNGPGSLRASFQAYKSLSSSPLAQFGPHKNVAREKEPSCSGCPFRQQIGAHRHWFPSAHHCLGFSCISWTILSCTHPPDPQPAYPVFCLPQRWAELSTFCSLCPPPLGSWRAVRA